MSSLTRVSIAVIQHYPDCINVWLSSDRHALMHDAARQVRPTSCLAISGLPVLYEELSCELFVRGLLGIYEGWLVIYNAYFFAGGVGTGRP